MNLNQEKERIMAMEEAHGKQLSIDMTLKPRSASRQMDGMTC